MIRRNFNAEIEMTTTVQAKINHSFPPRIEGFIEDATNSPKAPIIQRIYRTLRSSGLTPEFVLAMTGSFLTSTPT
jgi:hypothetical protein